MTARRPPQSVSDQNRYGREATRRVAGNSRRPVQGRRGDDRSIVALLVAITGQLKPLFVLIGLPEMAWPIVLVAVLAALALYFWRDYRRYARQSRLEQPDKFTLVATTPESLIGRATGSAPVFQRLYALFKPLHRRRQRVETSSVRVAQARKHGAYLPFMGPIASSDDISNHCDLTTNGRGADRLRAKSSASRMAQRGRLLATECRLSSKLRSFPRRPLWARSPPFCDIALAR